MASDYGNNIEPGVLTDVESVPSVSTGTSAVGTPVLVGQADLTNGSASADSVETVANATEARSKFGTSGLLTDALLDVLAWNVGTVYAVAPTKNNYTDDLSGLSSNTGSLANTPAIEDAASVTFTINGTALTTNIVYVDQASMSPGTDEASLNPVTGDFKLDSGLTVGNSGDDVVYDAFDYPSAHDAVEADKNAREDGDFFVPLNENSAVKTDGHTTLDNLASDHYLMLGLMGAGTPQIADISTYSNPFDTRRIQLVYPGRNADGSSVLGSYAGLRSRLGIGDTPIGWHLSRQADLMVDVPLSDRGTLINNFVTPFAEERRGARVADDVNTVSDDNTEDASIRYGFSTLVVDVISETLKENELPFIGKLHDQDVRNRLVGLMNGELRSLEESNAVIGYNLDIQPINSTEAELEVGVHVAEPLRFIHNNVAVGNTN